jgi:hypothetical protein
MTDMHPGWRVESPARLSARAPIMSSYRTVYTHVSRSRQAPGYTYEYRQRHRTAGSGTVINAHSRKKHCKKAARRCDDIRARAARSVGKARADRFARLAGGSEGRGGAWGSDSGGRRSGAVRVGRVDGVVTLR